VTPDLVLLDVMMPRMSGFDVCRELRREYHPAELPVIYLSARTQLGDRLSGFESGANDYLTKPIAKAELVARVRTHLDLLDVHRNLEGKVLERTEELQQLNAILERLAAVDALTQVANRRRFDEVFERAWADHQRRGAWLSLILVDIDYFKRYNDHYGHQLGDSTLSAVARALASCLERSTDLVARYGGEEFVLVLLDTPPAGAAGVAATLAEAVRALAIDHAASEVARHVTISAGVAAVVPSREDGPRTLIAAADAALYRAKANGRDRFVVDGA
jgi:diguanylate cyclase (GGDEF)-like protein